MNRFYKIYANLFAKPLFYGWNLRLFRFALSGLGISNHYNNKLSGESYFIKQILPKYLNNKPVLFDVGANVGNYSILLANKYPNASLHLFEPHPKNFEKLKHNTFSKNTHLNNMAVSNSLGTVEIFDYRFKDGSSHASVYKEVIEKIHGMESTSYEVEKTTLDNYVNERDISNIDLLKVDVEGHELDVFKGAAMSIRNSKINIIHFEFNEMNIESRTFLKDILDILQDYNLYRMLPKALLPLKKYKAMTHEIFAYQNIVAIKKDIDQE